MLHVVRHMFYGPYGTYNSMVVFVFGFNTKKGDCKVKLGQISKFKIFLQKHTCFVRFHLRIPEMLFILMYNR